MAEGGCDTQVIQSSSSSRDSISSDSTSNIQGKVCTACTFLNHQDLIDCEICDTPLPRKRATSDTTSLCPHKCIKEETTTTAAAGASSCLSTEPHFVSNIVCTDGLIELIHVALPRQNKKPSTYQLVSPCSHISQVLSSSTYNSNSMIMDNWSCGYRNIQMVISSLLQHKSTAVSRLFSSQGTIPSIATIQAHIEKAWDSGHDRLGSEGIGYPSARLLHSQIEIGACDFVALLHYSNIKATLVTFDCSKYNNSDVVMGKMLISWIIRYFNHHKQYKFICPIFLQHNGHSQCIVGYEAIDDGRYNLLLYDPSYHGSSIKQCLMNNRNWQCQVKRGFHTLKDQYQLVYIPEENNAFVSVEEVNKVKQCIINYEDADKFTLF